jgi:hypothetical protein
LAVSLLENEIGRQSEIVERDVQALSWLAEQYGARLDLLGVLLGHLAGREALSRRGTRNVVERWKKMGLAKSSVSLGAVWVTPTKKGIQTVGLPYSEWPFTATQLNHVHLVGVLRMVHEVRQPGLTWIGERAYRRQLGEDARRFHVPDALIEDPNNHQDMRFQTAIEVELTPKTRRRLEAEVFKRLHGDIGKVLYFTLPEHVERVQADVTAALAKVPVARPVMVHALPMIDGVSSSGVSR